MLRLFHAEGGATDGAYAMYGTAVAGTVGRVDAVLTQLKVGTPDGD